MAAAARWLASMLRLDAEDPVMLGQSRGEHRRHVDVARALTITLHFLQRDQVGAFDLSGDAPEIVLAILTEAVLDVVSDEFQDSLTARAAGTCGPSATIAS